MIYCSHTGIFGVRKKRIHKMIFFKSLYRTQIIQAQKIKLNIRKKRSQRFLINPLAQISEKANCVRQRLLFNFHYYSDFSWPFRSKDKQSKPTYRLVFLFLNYDEFTTSSLLQSPKLPRIMRRFM